MSTHQTVIDGIGYTTQTLPATKGLVILPKLLALFGEPVLKLFFVADEDQRAELLEDPATVAAILHEVARSAAEDNGLLVVKDLMVSTSSDKCRLSEDAAADIEGSVHTHFDTHFQGRYGHLVQVAMWVASSNFA
jgi:hypothetical protein